MINPVRPAPARRPRKRAPSTTVPRLPKWKIKQATDGRWYYVFTGANGEAMFQSTEFWERKSDAQRGRDQAVLAIPKAL